MPTIHLTTEIEAPIERVFDLARSIDAHMATSAATGEVAVAGRTSGLIEKGETVTWEARHFWVRQRLKVKITQLDRPIFFEDRMIRGAFASMDHAHTFDQQGSRTIMRDVFCFTAPIGILGRIAEIAFLKAYMQRFLEQRNLDLKRMAEGDEWKKFLVEPKNL